ncbi:patatin-like phospholipase family protein [Candidatus Wolfebacteria bacterium]|nr:patatin-like phospholipase family protein [Candidatus Wolfebacteria bacterium]
MMNLGKVGMIFNGGGFAGAYSVGFVKALAAKGIKPDFVQGISVGAISAAKLIGTNWDVGKLEKKWKEIEQLGSKSIFNGNWRGFLKNLRESHLFTNEGVAKILVDDLDLEAVMDSPIKFQVITFNEKKMAHQIFSNYDFNLRQDSKLMKQVMLAAVALQGFLPPVMINEEWHSDGGTSFIGQAIKAKCDTIFILSNTKLCHGFYADTNQVRWYRRIMLNTKFAGDLLEIRDIKQAIYHGYKLVENNPCQIFNGFHPLNKSAARKLKKIIRNMKKVLLDQKNIFVPRRIIYLTPANPIPSLYVLDFNKPCAKSSYPGDITMAIDQTFNLVNNEDFWSKF